MPSQAFIQARELVHSGITERGMETMLRDGRIGYYTYLWLRFAAQWTCPRFYGPVAERQDRAHDRIGPEAYKRRINKVRALFGMAPFYR